MTAIALRDATNETVAIHHQASNLADWAAQAREAAQVAISLAKTPFVPASLRDRNDPSVTAANITAAILTGQELGLEPMAALRSIDVIQGTPALRAIALRAVVLAAGHDMWVAESTQTRAIVRGKRRGSDQIQESIWTMDRAKALALSGKDNWRKQPGAMLVARATSECARLIAADALLGVPYTAEELDDGIDGSQIVPPTAGPQSTGRTARRRTTPAQAPVNRPPVEAAERAPEPEPAFDEESTSEAEPTAADAITRAQSTKLHALFGDHGLVERDERLAKASLFVGRELQSSNDLTKDEASALIDELESQLPVGDE